MQNDNSHRTRSSVDLEVCENTEHVRLAQRVAELEHHNAMLTQQLLRDPLTGLANRLVVEGHLERALSLLERQVGYVAVMFIDLDGFKDVNDRHGHAEGDTVLTELAARLQSLARGYDTVGRLSGDEFVVVCEAIHSVYDLDRVAHRYLRGCAGVAVGDGVMRLSASIGVAVASTGSVTVDELLAQADEAMYRSKSSGGARVTYADVDLNEQLTARRELEEGFDFALERHELDIDFAPLMGAANRKVVGFRTSVTWAPGGVDAIGQGALREIAERMDRTTELTDVMVTATLARLARGRVGIGTPANPLAIVDVAGPELLTPEFADQLFAQLERLDIPAPQLCLAVSVRFLTDHVADVMAELDRLASRGVRVARNGIATAGSPMAYFPDVPIDVVILDADVVNHLDVASRQFLALLHTAAHETGRQVLAPGIATAAHFELFAELGTDLIQGPIVERGPARIGA